MKVFISWSGQKSRDVAQLLHDWLPLVLHMVEPFVSSKDIRAGTRWQEEVASELDDTDFGLICVTRHNQDAPWLNFEAGALAKSVESSHVVPIAIDLSPAEIPTPLGQFQAITLTKDDVGDLVRSLNEACPASIADGNLLRTIEKWWPDLDADLARIHEHDYGSEDASASPARSDREMLEEVLDSVRGLSRKQGDSARRLRQSRDDVFIEIEVAARRTGAELGSVIRTGDKWKIAVNGPAPLAFLDELQMLEAHYGKDLKFSVESFPPEVEEN